MYRFGKQQAVKKDGHEPAHFRRSPFSATAVNHGGKISTIWHRDFLNLVFGVCGVSVLGHFDHRISGHVILKEFRTVVEIRPMDTYFIPSGCVTHRNAPLLPGDIRNSIVSFSAAGLFRWQSQGFKKKDEGKMGADMQKAIGNTRWKDGINLFSTISELQNPSKVDLTVGRALLEHKD
ncbi:hypothetical protein BD410DRAFT_728604 [Rickenella mellea]|uniref:Uncharacterized protein n=1 Tax=Rickenella mellea TaxID=50990 RepID=A0A4Y7PTV4_9AGAM|nr:hypothetical protein BD410DRAFT_728604 [Rickenella mellea]